MCICVLVCVHESSYGCVCVIFKCIGFCGTVLLRHEAKPATDSLCYCSFFHSISISSIREAITTMIFYTIIQSPKKQHCVISRAHTHIHTQKKNTHTHTYIHKHTHTYIHTQHIKHAYTHTHTHTHTHTETYTYTHIHTHTNTTCV